MIAKSKDMDNEITTFENQSKGIVDLNCNFSNLVSYLHNVNNQIYNHQLDINQMKQNLTQKVSEQQVRFSSTDKLLTQRNDHLQGNHRPGRPSVPPLHPWNSRKHLISAYRHHVLQLQRPQEEKLTNNQGLRHFN